MTVVDPDDGNIDDVLDSRAERERVVSASTIATVDVRKPTSVADAPEHSTTSNTSTPVDDLSSQCAIEPLDHNRPS